LSGDLVALSVILVLALAVRVWRLQAQSLTMDEVYELSVAKQSLGAILVTLDGFPPLYHLLLYWWLRVFGSDQSARWLSVLIGCLTVVVMWKLGRRLGGSLVGWASALLLAISPLHVWYSQEARAYALYLWCATLAMWLFFRAHATDAPRDWAWYGAAILAGLYTHYAFALLLVGFAAIVAIDWTEWSRLRRLALTHAAIAALALPWIWLARADVSFQMAWREAHPDVNLSTLAYALFSFVVGHSVGPSLRELHAITAADAFRETLPWAAAPGSACAYLIWLAIQKRENRSVAWRLILLIAAPLAICWLLSVISPLGFRVRYVAWCAIPLLVLITSGVMQGRGGWRTTVAAGVVAIISIVAILRRQFDVRYMNEDARGAASYLSSHADPMTPVFVISGYMADPVGYYLSGARKLDSLPNVVTTAELDSAVSLVRSKTQPDSSFWLVYSRPFHGDPTGRLLRDLTARARLTIRATLPGIQLYEGRSSGLGGER
jgi:uncharacterized membrane protein